MASPGDAYEARVRDTLSPYPAAQEDAFMQRFIQNHMTCILQPVAEHVRELREQMQRVAHNLAHCEVKADQTWTALAERSSELADLGKAVEAIHPRLDKLTSGQGAVCQDLAVLRVEIDAMKAQISETKGAGATNAESLRSLQRKVQEQVEGDLAEVRATAARSEKTLVEHAQRLAQTDDIYGGLNFQHLDLQRNVEALTRSCAASAQSLSTHLKEFEVRKQQDTAKFEKANEYVSAVEQLCGDAMRHSQRNEDNLRATDGLVRHLRATVDSQTWAATKVENAEQRWREAGRSLEDQSGRVTAVERAFDVLKRDMVSARSSSAEGWKDLAKRTEAQAAEIRGLEVARVAQSKAMNVADLALEEAQAEARRLREKIEAVEANVGRNSAGLQKWLQDSGLQLDRHSSELAGARLDIGELQRTVEAKGRGLRDLMEELGSTNEALAQLQSGHRAYMKSLQGLTKGFQETYKQVASGEAGMLAPMRQASGSTLPTISSPSSPPAAPAGPRAAAPRPSTASSTCTPRSETTQLSGWPTPPRSEPPERG